MSLFSTYRVRPASCWRLAKLLGVTLGLLAFGLVLPATSLADSPSAWTPHVWSDQQAQDLARMDLAGVAFANATDGWAVGISSDPVSQAPFGAIIATTDGGATWTEQNSGTAKPLSAVSFANALDGWAVGGSGSDNGTPVTGNVIIATIDGGLTWNVQTSGATADTVLTGVAFANASDGCAVGYNASGGVILTTTNGGAAWTARTSGTSADTLLTGVAFASDKDGWAVGRHSDLSGGVILATTDGGNTWRSQTPGTCPNLLGVAFADASHGWAVGDTYDASTFTFTGAILATSDGGAHWSAQDAGSSSILAAVACTDAGHAWTVGEGTILATANGGATWATQLSSNVASEFGVAFPQGSDGWAVGNGGTIWTGGFPLISLADASVNVGSPYVASGSFSDPTKDTWTATVDYGDSSGSQPLALNSDKSFALSHLYPGAGSYTVTVTVTAGDGAVGSTSAVVSVLNVAPSVGSITGPATAPPNTKVSFSSAFTDPGVLDKAVWNWGDGSTSAGTVTETNGSGSVAGSHVYTATGTYTITLTLTNKDGSVGTASTQCVVASPSATGYAAGIGWINSPAGAYPAKPTLKGKACFAFFASSGCKTKGPTACTDFDFCVAPLDFDSTSCDSLTISGAKVVYTGTGKLSCKGTYGFLVSAIDGKAAGGKQSTFRIKIWNKATGAVVYDTQRGAADSADPTTVLGGGCITVHS